MNDIKRSPMANTLVLHDFKREAFGLSGWFGYTESWFQSCNVKPSKMDVIGPSGIKGVNTITFSNGKKRLHKVNFAGVDGIWIGALPAECGTEMFDFLCAVDGSFTERVKTVIFCWDNQLVGFEKSYLSRLAQEVFAFFEPAYGYCYQRLFKEGPSFYPFGILSGIDKFSDEADRIDKWGKEYRSSYGTYRTGLFRDIYPMNFVCDVHLTQQVNDQTLQQWIVSDPAHGELSAVNDTLWSWWLPDENITAVREALKPTGLLLCA